MNTPLEKANKIISCVDKMIADTFNAMSCKFCEIESCKIQLNKLEYYKEQLLREQHAQSN